MKRLKRARSIKLSTKLRGAYQWVNKLFKATIVGKNDTLEHLNANALLFSASLISIFSCIFNFIESSDLLLNLFTVFSSLVLIVLYYLSRFKNYYNIWISALSIMLLLSISWLMNGGAIGSTTYMYLYTIIILNIIAKREQQNAIFILILVNLAILYFIEFYFGDILIREYPSKQSFYEDMVFVFMLILFFVFFITRFIKRSFENERNLVGTQKLIIESQNSELLSSLTYASYIQKKIISDESSLSYLFADYFVLFKPKDIVSGDYYWIKEKGNYSVVVVADCTGHGVPAAFLSIMGISLLEEILKQEREELNAARVLEKLRIKFIAYLERNNTGNEYSRDGMDLGICIVNYQEYNVQYAGANIALAMVRSNNQPETISGYKEKIATDTHSLYSFKPTKNSIGFNYKETPFTNHKINFHQKDTFYLFSDGFSDQFDATNSKKFTMRKLRKELLKIQDLPMATQAEYLDNLHKRWKGGVEQTDDILIIGIKI